jgi:hypothetical protein
MPHLFRSSVPSISSSPGATKRLVEAIRLAGESTSWPSSYPRSRRQSTSSERTTQSESRHIGTTASRRSARTGSGSSSHRQMCKVSSPEVHVGRQ